PAPASAAPKSGFPLPPAPTRSTPVARSQSAWSFYVLHLLAQFLDLRFDFQRHSRDRQRFAFHAGRLGKHGVGFAMHLLQKKIEFLSQLSGSIQQLGELLQVTLQPV